MVGHLGWCGTGLLPAWRVFFTTGCARFWLELYAAFTSHLALLGKQLEDKRLHGQMKQLRVAICIASCRDASCSKLSTLKLACHFAKVCRKFPGFVLLNVGDKQAKSLLIDTKLEKVVSNLSALRNNDTVERARYLSLLHGYALFLLSFQQALLLGIALLFPSSLCVGSLTLTHPNQKIGLQFTKPSSMY